MNKTLKAALGVVLTIGFIGSALAQDQFPDVPENHWAYEALANMKKNGLLVGYPDGLFRGPRPATRYELAVAVHATYQYLKNITDGLDAQIKAINVKDYGPDIQSLKDALEALKSDVAAMKGWGDDIANLKKMASTFEKELASLGVDVEAMKKDLKDLNDRVTKLEKNALPITIHGTVDFFMAAGANSSGHPGFTVDGRPVGLVPPVGGAGITPPVAGFSQDLSVFHEAAFKIAGTNETGPTWHATLLVGNLLNSPTGGTPGGGGAGSSGYLPGSTEAGNFKDGGPTQVGFAEAAAEFGSSLLGQHFSAKVGRFGYKISPYLFQRADTTPYFSNEWWDNGEHTIDGALLGWNFGSAKLDMVLGRTSEQLMSGGASGSISSVNLGAGGIHNINGLNGVGMQSDNMMGFHLNVPLGESGSVDLAYLFHTRRNDTPGFTHFGGNQYIGGGWIPVDDKIKSGPANRAQVFGGEANYKLTGNVKLNGGFAQSNVYSGNNSIITKNNYAWHLGGSYDADRWGLSASYREIMPDFVASGDWGRIGTWWNPTDIRGFNVGAHFSLTDALKLSATGEWNTGTSKQSITSPLPPAGSPSTDPFDTGDHIDRYTIDLDYTINDQWNAMLGFEGVTGHGTHFLDARPGHSGEHVSPEERWFNIGLGWKLSDMASMRFLWQISAADTKGAGFFGTGTDSTNTKLGGSLLTTQFTIKF